MSRLEILNVATEEFFGTLPNIASAVGQGQLIQRSTLAARVAKISTTGLLPDQTTFKQGDRTTAAA